VRKPCFDQANKAFCAKQRPTCDWHLDPECPWA
jgi:hypothetical protein